MNLLAKDFLCGCAWCNHPSTATTHLLMTCDCIHVLQRPFLLMDSVEEPPSLTVHLESEQVNS